MEITSDDLDTLSPVADSEWEASRTSSLLPGGFGATRTLVWPRLLHAQARLPTSEHGQKPLRTYEDPDTVSSVMSHRDERQIRLDTDRSFVLYPVDIATQDSRESLQSQLHELLISVFRKRPKLCYFQGYHDIVTVIFLTLPPETQLSCVEQLSLHRVRDSMGPSLEPVLGLLRVMKGVLRLADPSFAALLERTSPLPYFALSNLLTLFAHDMPTLALAQHVFDYLLCRPPILIVYLATAIALSRKHEVERFEEEGEDGMIHSLLSALPDISDEALGEQELSNGCPDKPTQEEAEVLMVDHAEYEPLDDQTVNTSLGSDPDSNTQPSLVGPGPVEPDQQPPIPDRDDIVPQNSSPDSLFDSEPPTQKIDLDPRKLDDFDVKYIPPPSPPAHPRRPKVSLTSLLMHADELYKSYPPTHPSVDVSSIMGPQSVVFTWSEITSDMPDDDEAEAMVEHPELIVKPYVERYPEDKESDGELGTRKRGRRKPLREPNGLVVQRKTMVVGAVLVLGVAMVVYGMRSRPNIGEHIRVHGWRRLERWLGGILQLRALRASVKANL